MRTPHRGGYLQVLAGIILILLPLPTWAASIVVGSFTKNTTTGTQIVSHSLGETPKVILTWNSLATSESSATDARFAIGASDGTREGGLSVYSIDAQGTTAVSTRLASKVIAIKSESEADLTAWSSSTFTLDWTTNLGSAATIHYALIGGTDVSARVHSWSTSGTGAGTQAVTGVGFEPDAVLHFYSGSIGSIDSTALIGDLSLGAMDATGREWAVTLLSGNGSGTSNTQRGQRTERWSYDLNGDLSTYRAGSFSSMDSDGFTVSWTTNPNSVLVHSVCLKGLNARVDAFTKSTSGAPASQAVTGVNFNPELLFLASWQRTSSTSAQVHSRIGFGATDGTNEGAIACQDTDALGTTAADRIGKTSKVFVKMDNSSGTVDAEADLTRFDDDGFTLNWTTNDAVATQICYLALVPFDSIAVRLADLRARASPTGVELTWRSESEFDNVGFHVYRETSQGERVRVTQGLIGGSLFFTGHGVTARSSRRYRWHDPNGNANDVYWIEDIESSGARQLHGPVTAIGTARMAGGPTPAAPAAPASGSSAAAGSMVMTPALAPRYLNPTPIRVSVQSGLANRPALKIAVDREGWYRVGYQDWIEAGLPDGVESRRLQLFARGYELAIRVSSPTDRVFGPGDEVLFYGLGSDTVDSDQTVYWLVAGDAIGQRIPTVRTSVATSTIAAGPTSVSTKIQYTPEHLYLPILRNGQGDNFFGELISDAETEIECVLPEGTMIDSPLGSIDIALQGIGQEKHCVEIRVEGEFVGEVEFSAGQRSETRFRIPRQLVCPGPFRVSLRSSASGDFSFLDWIAITFERQAIPPTSLLRKTSKGSTPVVVSEVTSETQLFDVTDPTQPIELIGNAIGPSPSLGSGFTVGVHMLPGSQRVWSAVTPETYLQPVSLQANAPSSWRSESQGAEFVILTPPEWESSLKPLARARRASGLSTQIISIDDIYDEWSAGAVDSGAIRDFVRHASRRWTVKPRYLLLVGDTSYDSRQRIPGSQPSWIPTRLIDGPIMETASDTWFGDLDGDGTAEVAVGRLPFESAAKVTRYVARHASNGSTSRVNRIQRALLVADEDDRFSFGDALSSASRQLDSPAWMVSSVDRNSMTAGDSRATIQSELRQGTDLVVYFGHGGTDSWSSEDLLNTDTLPRSPNRPTSPIVISVSCLNGFFHHRSRDTIAESWVDPLHGGALAVFASTDVSNPYAQRDLGLELIRQVTDRREIRLGDALLAAQRVSTQAVARTTVLLGDPTLPSPFSGKEP